jgi:OmpA-OmpF porin, OOP family
VIAAIFAMEKDMPLLKSCVALGLAALAAIASPSANAQTPGFYAGGNFGRSSATIDDSGIRNGLATAGFATTSISDRDRDTAYKLFGGYQLNPNFAIEAGFFDLGKFGYTATTLPAGTLRGDIRLKGLNLDLVAILPVVGKLSLLGRVGATYTQAKDRFRGTGAVIVTDPNPSKRDLSYKIGAGAMYDFTPNVALRAEVERYRIDDAVGNKGHVDVFFLGLVYRFGG